MVFMPPRHGKSTLVSHYFPAWFLGRNPRKRVILTSYESDFAVSWSRRVRDTLEEFGEPIFGVRTRQDSRAANRWELEGTGGGMFACGVGGPLTGKGADLAIIDDPVKNAEEATSEVYREKTWDWYTSTLYTRLEPGGAVVLMQTRWHVEDLAGCLLRDMEESGERWEVITMPAIADREGDALGRKIGEPLWPERYGLAQLAQIQKTMQARGEAHWWESLYQQQPIHTEALEWPEEYFTWPGFWFEEWPRTEMLDLKVMALDPSKGKDADRSDFSAIVKLGRDKQGIMYIEADVKRRPIADIVSAGVEHCKEFHPEGFAIETNQFQELLVTEFVREGQARQMHLPIYQIDNSVKKEVRIRRIGPYLAQHQMRFKANSPGTSILVRQMRDFPAGLHDDGPDSLEMALRLGIEIWNGKQSQMPTRIVAR